MEEDQRLQAETWQEMRSEGDVIMEADEGIRPGQ